MSQICQRSLNAPVAPSGVLFGHPHAQLLHFLGDTRSATRSSLRASVELLRDEAVIPAQERVGRDEGRHRFEPCASKRVSQRGEAAVFGIGQAQPAPAVLGFEDAILFLEIGDDVLLVTLEPPGNHGDQDMENHSCP